jgi:multidrug efflux system membrane fusion protein
VKADSTVTVRPITIGTTEGDDSEVTAGLTPGETVVMTGVDKLQEGTKVTAQIPAANSPVSPSATPSAGTSVNPSAKKAGKARKGT